MKVFITGGSSEIAQGIIKRLFSKGHDILTTSSSKENMSEVENVYKKLNIPVRVIHHNLSESSLTTELSEYLLNECEVLILNAASKVEKLKLFHHMKSEELSKSIDGDILGNCLLIQKSLEGMVDRKFGRIIFISSTASNMGTSRYGLYCLTKNAIEGLINNLSIDYGKHNILSNTISPGLMQTERTKRFW